VGPDVLVGLFVEPSVDMIVGMLAILKAGGAYLLLDISSPPERLAFMLQDGQVSLLLTQRRLQPQLPQHDCHVLCLDGDWPTETYDGEQNPHSAITPDNLIYVMYTSGSTGAPKGVAIRHGAVHQLVRDQNYIQINPTDRIGQGSNIAFDAATFEIWGPLLNGATMVGIPKETMLSPKLLAAYLREQQISVLFLTTALFNQVAGAVPDTFRTLRYLLFGGEAVSPRWVAEVLKHGAPENLLHVYGPTECTTYATWYRVQDVPAGATTIPIGSAIAGTVLRVLDEQRQPVLTGTPGELYIGGAGLARGYLNRADLNAAKFVDVDGLCLYRTGDLVRCLPDGNLEFLGRTDNQVKIRGFRIELGEIETALGEHPAIHQAVVSVHEDQPGEKRLVAYFVPTNGYVPRSQELRGMLKTRLPGYMIPQTFIQLGALPLNPNGKVDRRALPRPDITDEDPTNVVAPRTPTEAALARIWSQVLQQRLVGIHDNFFDLGGHSLLAVQAIAQVEHELQLRLPVSQFFAAPTIAEQAQWLDQMDEKQGRSQAPSVQPVARQGSLPLSFPQRQLWLFAQLHPSEPVYNETIVYHMREGIDANVLAQALTTMVNRHEAFRTTFTTVDEEPKQIIHEPQPFSLRNIDLTHLPVAERETVGRQLATAELTEQFDLEQGPLFRMTLIKLGDADWRLYLSAHHLILDGVSMYRVFLPELEAVYRARLDGQTPLLPELPIQQADFAAWQQQELTDEMLADQLAYWTQKLAHLPVLQLPTDRPYAAKTSYRGAQQYLRLSKELTEQLKTLSREEGVTLFVTLAAVINTLLYRYTGQEDVVLGTVHSGRLAWEVQNVIGNFLNNLVLRTDLSGEPSFRELLAREKTVIAEAYQHPDVPFEKLVNALQPERLAYQNPLFQVAFVMEPPMPSQDVRWGLSQLEIHSRTSKFDLLFELDERPEGIIGRIEYSSDLFDDATITRLIGHLQVLLEGVVANPTESIARLPLLTQGERQFLLKKNTAVAYPQDVCLHHLFAAQVEQAPDAVAVVFEGDRLTYAELDQRANQLAHYLCQHGVQPNTFVGVCAERSLELVIALYAVLKAGGAYLPIDPDYPAERMAVILEDAQPVLVLTQAHLQARIAPPQSPPINVPAVCLDSDWPLISRQPDTPPLSPVAADDLAYVIYTSGSTGRPKGVMIEHKGIVNRLLWMQDEYRLTAADRVLQKTPFTFDVSVWEFFWPLLTGACLVMARPEGHKDPAYLVDVIQRERITTLHFVPSMLSVFLENRDVAGCRSVRQVMCSGEALPYELQERFFAALRQSELHNLYGPTEASVDVTYWPCQREGERQIVPIGYPVANTEILILDKHLQPTPVGIPGELHIGGIQLAKGYLNRPELTKEKFISHPFSSDPDARLYKTGDLARRLPDGAIEYLGRIDHQVKLHGLRIELGEIESVLGQHPAVRDAVVTVWEAQAGAKRLIAYVVPHEPVSAGSEPSLITELRDFCLARLPKPIVPSSFALLPEMPLTSSGKVNRRALPAPEAPRDLRSTDFVAPRTATERLMAEIWAAALSVSQVGVHDNFFELGGDSMRAIQVLAKARQQGLELSLAQLFAHQTIAALARLCHPLCHPGQTPAPTEKPEAFSLLSEEDRRKLPNDLEDAYPLSALQAGMIYHTEMDPGTDVYHDLMGSRVSLPFELEYLRSALQELAERHPVLRTSVALTGFSEPLQMAHRNVTVPILVEDLRHLSWAEQEAAIDVWFAQEKRRAFDWQTAPLLRVQVHQRGPECFNLTLSFHHILLEGWSIATLLTELFQLYLTALGKMTRSLPPPPVSRFRDFVALERQALQNETARNYWVNKFEDKPLAQLPRWPASYRAQRQPGVVEIQVPAQVSERLRQLASTARVPFKSVLLAVHLRMLRLHCNQAGVTTGLVTNIRPETPDAERVLGLYLNTLPFYLDLSGGTWIDLVQATFKAEQADIAFREYPLAEIQRHFARPLFETIFNIVHFHVYQDLLEHEGLDGINEKVFQRTNFPLLSSFVLDPRSARLERIVMDYDGQEVCLEQAQAMGASYLRILEAMGASPEERYETCRLSPALSLMGEPDDAESRDQGGLHALFEAQVERTPDAIALASPAFADCAAGTTYLTYRELNQSANQLAHYLQSLGVGPETLVGLCVERSPEMVIGMLGILKAGGAYVPFDPNYPQARLAFMQEDAQLQVMVTQSTLLERLPAWDGAFVCPFVCLDADRSRISEQRQENPVSGVSGANLAYVLYTSGSTGAPKGVAIEHRQTMNLLHWARDTYSSEELQGVLAATSLNFDLSVFEILAPLSWGGKVIVAESILDLPGLAAREEITLVNTVPSTMTNFLIEQLPASVRVVNFAGEPLKDTLAQRVYERETVEKVFNLYGPTEATTYATSALIPRRQNQPITIGRPIRATEVQILDEHLQPVPIGVPGELHLGGAGLARGYLHRPELTNEKFIQHPFSEKVSARLYKTGDLARLLPDNTIEYLGRIDRQVKIRGLRIELQEVEAALLRHPAVQNAVVIAREDNPGAPYLAAYLAPEEGRQVSICDLHSASQRYLPACMVPHTYTVLDRLPLNANGKVDHRALPIPERTLRHGKENFVAPQTPAEQHLARIWADLLGLEKIGIHDNFFDLGGHSILGMEMIARASRHGLHLTIRHLRQAPTIAALAQAKCV
jgi:amino acid adenylation domain-containing protein